MDRINYRCNSCGYDFSRNSTIKFLKCPYCGKKGTIELKKGDFASRLLEDVPTGEL